MHDPSATNTQDELVYTRFPELETAYLKMHVCYPTSFKLEFSSTELLCFAFGGHKAN